MVENTGGPSRIRTLDQLIKSQLLYRTELTAPEIVFITYTGVMCNTNFIIFTSRRIVPVSLKRSRAGILRGTGSTSIICV